MTAQARERPAFGGTLGAALLAAALFAVATIYPQLGLLAITAPFPLILSRLRSGLGGGLTSSLLAVALLGALLTPGQAVAFGLFLGVPALLIGEAMDRGRGLRRGCTWGFVYLAFLIGGALLLDGAEMAARVLEPLDQYRSPESIAEMKKTGLAPERIEDVAEQFASLRNALAVVYPAAYIIMGALVVLANATLLRIYLARRDPGLLEDGEFERTRLPLGLAVVFVLAGLGVLLDALRPAAYNVLLVLAFFFALQGLAVVAYYVHRLAAPSFLRLAVLVLVLVNPWAKETLALLGLFDIWLDFRKYAEAPEDPPRGA